ncbi:MAG: hypothetical protein HY904_21885 [Deltaproteobacteria bacterium]|nr:hypothetical protein [Deltaproteobacteria bacterium]
MNVTIRPKNAPPKPAAPAATPATTTHAAPGTAAAAPAPAPSSAPVAPARHQPTATAQSASEAHARSASAGGITQAAVTSRMALAVPEMAAPGRSMNTRFKLPEQRTQLLLNSPQVDRVTSTTNDDVRCGGAAAANAIIMDSKDATAAQNNAAATRRLAKDRGVELTQPQKDAVTALEKGEMTPTNSAHLQEAMFAIGRSSGDGLTGGGLSVDQMSNLAAGLRERGGLAHSNPTFHLNRTPAAHWTVTTGDGSGNVVHINSQKRAGTEYAQVTSGDPKELGPGGEDSTGNPTWGGSVTVNNYGERPSLNVSVPTENGKGELQLDSPNFYSTDHDLDPSKPGQWLPYKGATKCRRSDGQPVASE